MKTEREAGYSAAKAMTGFLGLLLLTILGAKVEIEGVLTVVIMFAAVSIAFGAYAFMLDYYGGTDGQFMFLLLAHLTTAFLAIATLFEYFVEWVGWVFAISVLIAHVVLAKIDRDRRKHSANQEPA